jgi:hypothetical protein
LPLDPEDPGPLGKRPREEFPTRGRGVFGHASVRRTLFAGTLSQPRLTEVTASGRRDVPMSMVPYTAVSRSFGPVVS